MLGAVEAFFVVVMAAVLAAGKRAGLRGAELGACGARLGLAGRLGFDGRLTSSRGELRFLPGPGSETVPLDEGVRQFLQGEGGEFLFAPAIHRIGLAVALVIAAVAIGWGAITHRRAAPFVTAMMGLTFMGGALAMPHGAGEVVLTIIGVALVSLGHLLNLRHAH